MSVREKLPCDVEKTVRLGDPIYMDLRTGHRYSSLRALTQARAKGTRESSGSGPKGNWTKRETS